LQSHLSRPELKLQWSALVAQSVQIAQVNPVSEWINLRNLSRLRYQRRAIFENDFAKVPEKWGREMEDKETREGETRRR